MYGWGKSPDHEIAISKHLKNPKDYFSKVLIRLVLDLFEVVGPHMHPVFVATGLRSGT